MASAFGFADPAVTTGIRARVNCVPSSFDSPADVAQPDWWALAKAHKHKLSLLAAEENGGDSDGGAYFASPALEAAPVGVWSSPFLEGPKRPPPRYEHAAATVGPNLYVLGGNCGAWPPSSFCDPGDLEAPC